MKIRNLQGGGQAFFCPGCDHTHAVNSNQNGPRWDYNGNPGKPTFSPSILVTCDGPGWKTVCHSFVRDGQIQFLGDCTHELVGQTVEVPEWPYAPGTYGGVEDAA